MRWAGEVSPAAAAAQPAPPLVRPRQAPPLLRAGVDLLRGYAGDITPAAALSAVESEVRRSCSCAWRACQAPDAVRGGVLGSNRSSRSLAPTPHPHTHTHTRTVRRATL